MTIPEIAAQLRIVLGVCVNADKGASPAERRFFTAVQNDASDEEVISFWLSVSYLEKHRVLMFVVKQWGQRASNISEWMAPLERNTAPLGEMPQITGWAPGGRFRRSARMLTRRGQIRFVPSCRAGCRSRQQKRRTYSLQTKLP